MYAVGLFPGNHIRSLGRRSFAEILQTTNNFPPKRLDTNRLTFRALMAAAAGLFALFIN